MTQAEIMELINIKRHSLEDLRLSNPVISPTTVKVLEDEIKTLELSLARASAAPKRSGEKKVFLDECAG
jgi:hypothetical protein